MTSRRAVLLGGFFLGLGAASRSFAQGSAGDNGSPPRHIRGTIVSSRGGHLVVREAGGTEATLLMTKNTKVAAISRANLHDIRKGEFIGTATTGPDDHLVAREVVIFPNAMRGTAEGHYPWDLGSGSMMTNGNIAASVVGTDGRTLTVEYKGGESKIVVPPSIPVVRIAPGKPALLRPGAKVFAIASAAPDGALSAIAVLVGVDGVTPPM